MGQTAAAHVLEDVSAPIWDIQTVKHNQIVV
jgi:hypothetical protein